MHPESVQRVPANASAGEGCPGSPECRSAFLSAASEKLLSSLDPKEMLRIIARLAVPDFADWVAVDIVAGDSRIDRITASTADASRNELVETMQKLYPPRDEPTHGARMAIATGRTDFVPEVTAEILAEIAIDKQHLAMLEELDPRSFISAPLIARGRPVGAISLVYAASGRRYTVEDCRMVEDLARRAGTALGNAHLVDELRDARSRLRQQAVELEERQKHLDQALTRLELAIKYTPLAVVDVDQQGRVLAWNPGAERTFGYTAEEMIGERLDVIFADAERFKLGLERSLRNREGVRRGALANVRKDGKTIVCAWYAARLVDTEGKVIGLSGAAEDITDRIAMQREVQRQMGRINALRSIDLAIASSMEITLTLAVLLDQVIAQLGVDAAAVLLLNQHHQALEYAVGRGFRGAAIQKTSVPIGEGSAGRAVRERRTISLPNLEMNTVFLRAEMVESEEFVAHYCTPLIAKGKVVGVLEVYNRTPLAAGQDWLGFFETLAGQAAIAVENARLFADLQKSNLELAMAYDSTLEGWARALDLHDNVTEGHSRRVTAMTERLAKEVGIADEDIVNIRRGALLHDIGKMGIPESILRKEGPLNDKEWDLMRKHPGFARELLAPIEYLRPALDIPYAHHERWDGTGYPRGLKGEEIPLAARIFAIVDVWDALRSKRSYSDEWPEASVREHIRGLAGTHLDPALVEVFLGMEW
jgi:PAS domain S-box-containing protein/putative nucleotidyltransferase with HDIG domain